MEQVAYLGENSIDRLEDIFSKILPKRVFLVRGKKSYITSGAKEQIEKFLISGIHITDFFDFEENPKIEDVEKGLLALAKCESDLIISIGGGSVLDMAKLIRFFHSYVGEPTENCFQKCRELIPLIAIPTTAGTGSETTHFAVVYKNRVKYSIAHEDILPNVAIINPEFTYNNPKYLTACTGFDALAQAIEAYWNVKANNESDEYAMKAIQLLWTNLPLVVNLPTKQIRDKISEGAYWAGRAINITQTTAPHALSYPFTTYYGYPHGHAVALSFPFFIEYNTVDSGKYLNDKINLDVFCCKMDCLYTLLDTTKDNIRQKMMDFITSIGLNLDLFQKNICRDLIISHINTQRSGNNPRVLSKVDFEKALDDILK